MEKAQTRLGCLEGGRGFVAGVVIGILLPSAVLCALVGPSGVGGVSCSRLGWLGLAREVAMCGVGIACVGIEGGGGERGGKEAIAYGCGRSSDIDRWPLTVGRLGAWGRVQGRGVEGGRVACVASQQGLKILVRDRLRGHARRNLARSFDRKSKFRGGTKQEQWGHDEKLGGSQCGCCSSLLPVDLRCSESKFYF
eukprot:129959-Rhodomonas_salina.1